MKRRTKRPRSGVELCEECRTVAAWESRTPGGFVTFWCPDCHAILAKTEGSGKYKSNVKWRALPEYARRATDAETLMEVLTNFAAICRTMRRERLIVPRETRRLKEFVRGLR